ncbi:hypothetical protein MKW92_049624 [Papaver armeniacum]|nr:hypothetical protein MKW92_049624 [Papaver armeniacum]
MSRNDAVDNSPSSSSPSLRICKSRDQSKYKGITKRKWGKWVSEIRLPKKAARAFDAALFCLRGTGAQFNFPDNPPNIQGVSSQMTRAEIKEVAARYANEEEEDNEDEDINRLENETTIENNGNNGDVDRELLDLFSLDLCDYSGVNDFPGDILALTSPQGEVCGDYGDENDGEIFYNHSSLWNF